MPSDDLLAQYLLHNSRGLVEVTKFELHVIQFIYKLVRERLFGQTGLAQVDAGLEGNSPGRSHVKLAQTYLGSIPTGATTHHKQHR